MARLGRRIPNRSHTENLPPQTLQESAGLTAIFGMSAGSTVTANATATLTVDFEIGANQNSAQLPVEFDMSAGAVLTLQQSAELDAVFDIGAIATEQFNSSAALPAVFSIGTVSNVEQSSTMAMVTNIVAVPTSGNLTLIASIAAAAGTDAMGNAYPQGLAVGIPLGPQSLFDVSGNATIQGNLEVDGTITNADLGSTLNTLSSQISALNSALATVQLNINILQNQVTGIQNTVNSLPINFLKGLTNSKLPHQTTNNNTISTTAGSLSNADRVSINGLVNAVNTLQQNLQIQGFETP